MSRILAFDAPVDWTGMAILVFSESIRAMAVPKVKYVPAVLPVAIRTWSVLPQENKRINVKIKKTVKKIDFFNQFLQKLPILVTCLYIFFENRFKGWGKGARLTPFLIRHFWSARNFSNKKLTIELTLTVLI